MIFLRESQYGWGVCNIPQPRATQDIFDDRRKLPHGTAAIERRLYESPKSIWAMWAALVKRDLPVLQVFSVLAVSLGMIILFGLASFYLPAIELQDPPPLEIIATMLEESVHEIPTVTVEPQVALDLQPVMRPEKPVARPLPKPAEPPQTVVLTPPKKRTIELPSRVAVLPDRPIRDTALPGPRTIARQYRETPVVAGPVPEGNPAATFELPMRKETLVASSSLNDRYSSKSPGVSPTALPKRAQPGLSTASGTEVDLPSSGGIQKNFKMAHTAQSLRGGGSAKSFVPGDGGGEVAIRRSSRVGGNLANSGVKDVASVQAPIGAKRSTGERVGLIGGTGEVEVPSLVGSGKAAGSLAGTVQSASSPAGDGLVSGSISFAGVEDGHYDPARMISLNQLKACIDPNAEWTLKTSLAAALDTDGKCSIRNMVFFFKNTENGYTLQVDLFNPEKFVDRCEALRTAIQCINP